MLGVISYKGNVTRDSSLNDYTQSGFWYDVIAASDSPVAQGHRTMLVVYKSTTSGSSVRISQQVYDLDTQEIYMRTASGSTWDAWSLVTYPTAMRQYQTLSSLATALGVGKSVGYINHYVSTNDADDFVDGFLMGMTDGDTRNIPVSTYGFLINFYCGGIDYDGFGVQIWIGSSGSSSQIFFRKYWNGWNSWREFSLVS